MKESDVFMSGGGVNCRLQIYLFLKESQSPYFHYSFQFERNHLKNLKNSKQEKNVLLKPTA